MPPFTTQAYGGPTATFTDASSTGTLSDFSATIDWGDGSSSIGAISGGPGTATYSVTGSHTYATTGFFAVKTAIADLGGSSTKAVCANVLVFAFAPGGGAFVIGDRGEHGWQLGQFLGRSMAEEQPDLQPNQCREFQGIRSAAHDAQLRGRLEHGPGQQRVTASGAVANLHGRDRDRQLLQVRLEDLKQHRPHCGCQD